MSRRTALWFALVGLLATTLASRVVAQTPNPWRLPSAPAPMPRAMPVCNDSGQFMFSGSYVTDTPAPPLCAFDRSALPATQSAPTSGEVADLSWAYYTTWAEAVRPTGNVWKAEPVPMPQPLPEYVPPQYNPLGVRDVILETDQLWKRTILPETVKYETPASPAPTTSQIGAAANRPEPVVGAATGRSEPAACCEKAGKLAGTWYRDLDIMVISATFTGDELKLCVTQSDEGVTACFTITADCAITKEGLVHGVITGADVNVKSDAKTPAAESLTSELLKMSHELQKYVDCPFAFRVKQTSAGIMVSGLRIAAEGVGRDELALVCGMYKHAADGKVPVAKPMKTATESGRSDSVVETATAAVPPMSPPTPPGEVVPMSPPANGRRSIKELIFGGMTLPSGRYLEHFPQYYAPGILVTEYSTDPRHLEHLPQHFPPAPAQSLTPSKPANVPAGDFGMMADVFGQMMTAQAAPPHVPCPVQPAALSQPAPRMLVVAPPVAAMPARPLTGTWVREVGPSVYVVKIADDHITMTVTGATEFEDGKVRTEGIILTADYHLMRDGTTLLGLVTGVDAICDGDLPTSNELFDMQESLDMMQKVLTDKPLAMSVRLYGDTLVIGNVRMPEYHFRDNAHEEALFPMFTFGGRYKSVSDRTTPKPKVVKMSEMQKLTPPPGPIYGPPPGVFGPPPVVDGPAFLPPPLPCPSRTPPGVAPAQPVIATGPYIPQPVPSDRIPPPTPRVNEVPPPPAPMTPPTPPVVDQPKEEKKGKKKKKNDAPSHLTPERIHGGIF